jgi:hypothetical protein
VIAGGRALSGIAGAAALIAGLAYAGELVPLSHRLNDIDSVRCDGTRVNFMGQDGTLTFDSTASRWTIDTAQCYPFPKLDLEDYWDRRDNALFSRLKNGPPSATYVTPHHGVAHDTTLMVLATTAGEGAVHDHQCIVNTADRVAYCFPVHHIKAFDFDQRSLWLGSYRGATNIDRSSGRRTDYIVLPFLDEHCSVYRDPGHIWTAVDGVGVQRITLRNGQLQFWSIQRLLEDLHQRWEAWNSEYKRPEGAAIFTNFEPDGDDLFLACRFADFTGRIDKRSSYLLSFSPRFQRWHAEWLGRPQDGFDAEGANIIRRFGRNLWIGCGHRQVWEGGGYKDSGGLFVCVLRSPQLGTESDPHGPLFLPDNRVEYIDDVETVNRDYLVTAMRVDGDLMFVETFSPEAGRKTTYKVSKDYRVTVVSDSLDVAFYNEFELRATLSSYRGKDALSDSLRNLMVTPVIRTLPADSVEVTRR